jgi:hypothetical protein
MMANVMKKMVLEVELLDEGVVINLKRWNVSNIEVIGGLDMARQHIFAEFKGTTMAEKHSI